MEAVLDLYRVLYDPVPVFERIRERGKFLMPFIALSLIEAVILFLMEPFNKAASAAKLAETAAANPAAAHMAETIAQFTPAFGPIGILFAVVVGASILWVLVSMVGGEAKWGTLVRLSLYAGVPDLLYQCLALGVLLVTGVAKVKTMQDLQPPLGLDLLAPNAGPVLQVVLGRINPLTIWGLVLTAIGVRVTQKTSSGAGYTVAIIAFLLGLMVTAGFAMLRPS